MFIILVSCWDKTADTTKEASVDQEITQSVVETKVVTPENNQDILTEDENIEQDEDNIVEDSQAIYELTASEEELESGDIPEKDEFTDWGWDYYDDENNIVTLYGPAEDGAVDFELWYANECTGFAGTAYLEKSWIANYYDDATSCQMNITYNPWMIEFSSYDCWEYVDPWCNDFTDTYKIQ